MSDSDNPEEEEYSTHQEEYYHRQLEIAADELQDFQWESVQDFNYEIGEAGEDLAVSTRRDYIRTVRELYQYANDNSKFDTDITNWSADDFNLAIKRICKDRDRGKGMRRNMAYASKSFVRNSIVSDADADDIDAPSINTTKDKIKDENVLSADEIIEMIEEADKIRDKAMLAVMFEGSVRRTELVQMDFKHYKTDRYNRVVIPDKEGCKSAGFMKPLTWSVGYLERWIANHPTYDPDEEDSEETPLFCSIRSQDAGKRLRGHSVNTQMTRIQKRADVDTDAEFRPHIFRHSRKTEMVKNPDLSKTAMENVMGWTEDTPMHKRYSHASAEEKAKKTAQELGVDIKDDEEQTIEECPRCGFDLHHEAEYCSKCTLRISDEAPQWYKNYKKIVTKEDAIIKRYDTPVSVPRVKDLDIESYVWIKQVLEIAISRSVRDKRPEIEENLNPNIDPETVDAVPEEDMEQYDELYDEVTAHLTSVYQNSVEELEMKNIDIEDSYLTD